jgi:hypothetical protein
MAPNSQNVKTTFSTCTTFQRQSLSFFSVLLTSFFVSFGIFFLSLFSFHCFLFKDLWVFLRLGRTLLVCVVDRDLEGNLTSHFTIRLHKMRCNTETSAWTVGIQDKVRNCLWQTQNTIVTLEPACRVLFQSFVVYFVFSSIIPFFLYIILRSFRHLFCVTLRQTARTQWDCELDWTLSNTGSRGGILSARNELYTWSSYGGIKVKFMSPWSIV